MADQSFHKEQAAPLDMEPLKAREGGAGAGDHRPAVGQSHEVSGQASATVQLSRSEAPAAQSAELATTAGSRDGSADAAVTLQFLYDDQNVVESWFSRVGGTLASAQGRGGGGSSGEDGLIGEDGAAKSGAGGGADAVEAVALAGVAGPGGPLPHQAAIQASFGRHDVSGLQAHVGGAAGAASRQIGAEAYTAGDQIAFDGAPSLHTAAHEAAHGVLQQRGIKPSGGVGAAGDPYEQHADAVADAVVQGKSAEGLLDAPPGGAASARPAASPTPIQQKGGGAGAAVQRQETGDGGTTTATPGGTGGTPPPGGGGQFVDEDGNPREPTDEEIDQMIREAQQQGSTQGQEVVDEAPPEAPPEAPVEPAVDGNEETPTVEGGGEGGAPPQLAAVPPGPGSSMASFQSLKSGPLSKWDDEVAWHEYFQGEGPTAGAAVDRDALIADALSGGAVEGFKAGFKNIAIDTAINLASSRIPYLQGFVEMARIAYDPAAWLESTVQSTYGNVVQGGSMLWEGLQSGDPIAALDGLLTILEGINNVISTLSTICWIVAAASFLLSFICPAAVPFAALAANWGLTLGSVSTAFGVFITLGRALVIALRMLQIKYGDADPQTLMEQGERLRAQTQAFTGEFTTRAGNKLRDRAQTRLQSRGQQQGGGDAAPTTRSSTASAQPRTRMQRVMGALEAGATVLTGGGSPRGAKREAIGYVDQDGNQVRGRVQRAMAGTRAYRGTGEYAQTPGGGPRSRRQQAADMEHAGLTVFHNDAARQRFEGQTPGQRAVNRELVGNHQAATRALDEAVAADREAQRRLQAADEAAAEAQRRLQAARDDGDRQRVIGETQARHEADVRRLARARAAAREKARMIGRLEAKRDAAEARGATQDVINLERRLIDARDTQTRLENRVLAARRAEAASNYERVAAREPMRLAEEADASARDHLAASQTSATEANDRRTAAEQGVRDANRAFAESDRLGGMTQADSDEARQRDATQREQGHLDFTGNGPTDLHGHNHGAGVTGAGTELVKQVEKNNEDPGNPLGVWDRTTDERPMDWEGNAGGRAGNENYAGQLQERFDTLKTSLPAPPGSVPDDIDGAKSAYEALDLEKRQITFQQEVMGELMTEADASMSALDAMEQVSQANQEAIAQHQGQLSDKQTAQDTLRTAGQETQTQASQGEASGGSTAETVGGFIGRFMEMLSIVPSRVLPGGGGGDGIQQVQTAAGDQRDRSADANAAAANAVTEADRMTTETTQAVTASEEDQAAMTGLDEEISAERLATTDGQTFLQETLADAEARQAELDGEMQRLQGEHQAAVQTGSSWATEHEAQRVAGLGELDGIVELIEAEGGGG